VAAVSERITTSRQRCTGITLALAPQPIVARRAGSRTKNKTGLYFSTLQTEFIYFLILFLHFEECDNTNLDYISKKDEF